MKRAAEETQEYARQLGRERDDLLKILKSKGIEYSDGFLGYPSKPVPLTQLCILCSEEITDEEYVINFELCDQCFERKEI